MQNINVLILEKCSLRQLGLSCLIKENFQKINVASSNIFSSNQLNEFRPDYIFINIELLKNLKIKSSVLGYKLIVFGNDDLVKTDDLTIIEHINDDCSTDEIIQKLQNIFVKLNENSDLEKTDELSHREIEVVKNVALGLTNQEIADKLFLSPHTVIAHRKNITRKLGIKTVSGLTVYAVLNNIISIS